MTSPDPMLVLIALLIGAAAVLVVLGPGGPRR